MRSLLLAVFIGLALASVDEDAFQRNRQYIFRYEAQLMTGTPYTSKLWSGLRMAANVNLFFLTDTRVAVKLTDVNLQKIDKFVQDRTPNFFMQPEETVLDGIEADVNIMIKQLTMPCAFTWTMGTVSQIAFDAAEPAWSANIKRGIIGLFEVNLNHKFGVSPITDKGIQFNPMQPPYVVWEQSTAGYCLTTYTAKPAAPATVMPASFYLTKVRDYSSCVGRAAMAFTFDNFMPEQAKTTEHLRMAAEVTYAIKGDKANFIILTAVAESKIAFVPYGQTDGQVHTTINQTMYLLNAMDIPHPRPATVPVPPPMKGAPAPMHMMMPVQHIAEDLKPYELMEHKPVGSIPIPFTWKKIDQVLTWVANGTHDYPSQDVLMTMQALMETVRMSHPTVLKQLLEVVVGHAVVPGNAIGALKLEILWNLMSTAGTTGAANVLLDHCINTDVGQVDAKHEDPNLHARCVSAVTNIGLYCPPSEKVIMNMIAMLKKTYNVPMEEHQMKMVTALAAGAVAGRAEDMVDHIMMTGHKQCQAIKMIVAKGTAEGNEPMLKRCQEAVPAHLAQIQNRHHHIMQTVAQEIKMMFLMNGMDRDIIIGLKALRNAHIPLTMEMIKKIMLDVQLPAPVRITACQALEKFWKRKMEVVALLEEVLKNPSELASVRIQAFRAMVNIRAPVEALIRVAGSIRYETEKQVSTYIWSVFATMAKSSFRPYAMAAAEFRAAIPFMRPIVPGIQDSQQYRWHLAMANNVAVMKEINYIATPDFVTAADCAAYIDLFGTANKAVQVSWMSEGLEQVIKKLMGPKGFFTHRNSLFDLLARTKRGTSAEAMIGDIFKKLGVEARRFPKTKAFMHLQMMNNVIRSWDFTAILQNIVSLNVIKANIDEKMMKGGMDFQYKTSGVMGQFFMELPTEAGFPVTLQMGLSYAIKMAGSLSAGVDASIYKNTRGFMPPEMIRAKLHLNPQVVAAVVGKMAVDGYIFQAGSLFHAITDVRMPITVSATVDLRRSRLITAISPPASVNMPVMKFELKPYVFTRAIANDVSPEQQPVDQRPVFHSMEPIVITHGAKMQQVRWTFGENWLGYALTWQGQYPWGAMPTAAMPPMAGRAHYALYITPGNHPPAAIRVDIRYLSEARFPSPMKDAASSSEEVQAPRRDVCDSWWTFLWCHGTDEEGAVDEEALEGMARLPAPAIGDIPDLGKHMTLQSLKKKIESRVGHHIPIVPSSSQWGIIAILDTSVWPQAGQTAVMRRAAVLEGVMQAWKEGQYHQAFFTVTRTPIPDYDPQPWTMAIKTSAIFPAKRHAVRDLVNPMYIASVQSDMMKLMRRPEHRIISKYFHQLMLTMVNEQVVQRLPTVVPVILLDRILPEMILNNQEPCVIKIRLVLKTLLPLVKQIMELKGEMKDALKVTVAQGLIEELGWKIIKSQVQIMKVMKQLRQEVALPVGAISAAEYTVLKLSQSVFAFRGIAERAASLHLVNNQTAFFWIMKKIDTQQLIVYRFSAVALSSKPMMIMPHKAKISTTASDLPMYQTHMSDSNPPFPMPSATHTAHLIASLMALTTEQMTGILDVWYAAINHRTARTDLVKALTWNMAHNVTLINHFIKMTDFQDIAAMELILQAAIQNQIVVEMLHAVRFGKNDPMMLTTSDNFDRFALKVQTQQLLEPLIVLLNQAKMKKTCIVGMTAPELKLMEGVKWVARQLVALHHDHIVLPSLKTPFTTDMQHMAAVVKAVEPVVEKLTAIRDGIVPLAGMPHPCLMWKTVELVTILQQKIAMFKKVLLAQMTHPMQLVKRFHMLEDRTMDLMLTLTPIFDKYVTAEVQNMQQTIFPTGNVLISEGLLEVTMIHNKQNRIIEQLHKFLFQFGAPPFFVVKRIMLSAWERCQAIVEQLEAEAERVRTSMQTTTILSAYSVYAQYLQTLQQQVDIFNTMLRQLQIYAKHPDVPRIGPQIEAAKMKLAMMLKEASGWKIMAPGGMPAGGMPGDADDMHPKSMFYYNDNAAQTIDREPWEMNPEDATMNAGPRMPMPMTSGQTEQIDVQNLPAVYTKGVLFIANVTYGKQKYLGIQMNALKSLEQMMWEMSQFYAPARDMCVARAIEQVLSGRERMEMCGMETERRVNSYQHVHINVASNADALPVVVDRTMQWWMRFMKISYYDRATVMAPATFIKPGTMQAIFDFSKHMDAVDQYYMTTMGTMVVQGMPLSHHVKAWYPFQNVAPVPRVAMMDYSNRLMPATCKVDRYNVMTNDGAVYTVPRTHSGCRTVLAMDCTSDMTFAITMQPKPKGPGQILQIIAEEHVIRLVPDFMSDRVIVNGQEQDVRFGVPIIKYKTIAYGQEAVAVVVSRPRGGYIRVEYPLVGLDIIFDFNYIAIHMSNVFKNQLCGLCGNFDGQITKEMEGPKRTIFAAAENFFRAYVIPDDQCPAAMLPVNQPMTQPMAQPMAKPMAQPIPVNRPMVSSARYMARPQVPASMHPMAADVDGDFAQEFAE